MKKKKLPRFKPGSLVQIDGKVGYFQDMRCHRGEFPGVVFTVSKHDSDESLWLSAPGMGGEPYGNGRICVYDNFERVHLSTCPCAMRPHVEKAVTKLFRKHAALWRAMARA